MIRQNDIVVSPRTLRFGVVRNDQHYDRVAVYWKRKLEMPRESEQRRMFDPAHSHELTGSVESAHTDELLRASSFQDALNIIAFLERYPRDRFKLLQRSPASLLSRLHLLLRKASIK